MTFYKFLIDYVHSGHCFSGLPSGYCPYVIFILRPDLSRGLLLFFLLNHPKRKDYPEPLEHEPMSHKQSKNRFFLDVPNSVLNLRVSCCPLQQPLIHAAIMLAMMSNIFSHIIAIVETPLKRSARVNDQGRRNDHNVSCVCVARKSVAIHL